METNNRRSLTTILCTIVVAVGIIFLGKLVVDNAEKFFGGNGYDQGFQSHEKSFYATQAKIYETIADFKEDIIVSQKDEHLHLGVLYNSLKSYADSCSYYETKINNTEDINVFGYRNTAVQEEVKRTLGKVEFYRKTAREREAGLQEIAAESKEWQRQQKIASEPYERSRQKHLAEMERFREREQQMKEESLRKFGKNIFELGEDKK